LHLLLRLNKVILANRFKHATDHDHVGDEIEAVDVLVGQIPTPPIVKIDLLSPSQVLSRLPRCVPRRVYCQITDTTGSVDLREDVRRHDRNG
jgi:hypothetical protein